MRKSISVVGVLFAIAACGDRARDEADARAATNAASNAKQESYCRLLEAKYEASAKAKASGDLADPKKSKAYFAEQKERNAAMLIAAPPEVRWDTEFHVKNSNAMYEAELAGRHEQSKAAASILTSQDNVDASRRMREFCGLKTPSSS